MGGPVAHYLVPELVVIVLLSGLSGQNPAGASFDSDFESGVRIEN